MLIAKLAEQAARRLAELSRRANLARTPAPAGVSRPPALRLIGEIGGLSRVTSRAARQAYPVASLPQPVMLLPGFFSHPFRMRPLKVALEQAGHQVEDWGMGFNFGPTPENFAGLLRRVERMARRHGVPVALIGWSLGGLFAREVACRLPESVARVITMGRPFSVRDRARRGRSADRARWFAQAAGADDCLVESARRRDPSAVGCWLAA
jgi:pimeloyl-ACP methyl ester carboxylesterase